MQMTAADKLSQRGFAFLFWGLREECSSRRTAKYVHGESTTNVAKGASAANEDVAEAASTADEIVTLTPQRGVCAENEAAGKNTSALLSLVAPWRPRDGS